MLISQQTIEHASHRKGDRTEPNQMQKEKQTVKLKKIANYNIDHKEASKFPYPGRDNRRRKNIKKKQTQTQIHKREKKKNQKKISLVKLKTEAIEEGFLTFVAAFSEKRSYNLPCGVIGFNQQHPQNHPRQKLLPSHQALQFTLASTRTLFLLHSH